jgi:hypothetical protein
MQVVCGNCQLNFQAPEGATGLVCPICRSPLAPQAAAGDGGATAKKPIEWNGGTLDDIIAILTAPAICARVEVLPAAGDAAAGEVHLLAGGVSDAIFAGQSTDDALDRLRAVSPARFRIEQRLPNPTDGDLTYPGAEAGTLDGRPLAHLMRYCEDYVITCAIEVWRGSENARVEYRRGEIGGVTVGGIDAPERLAEVMKWSSGNYRLVTKPIELPAVAPKRPQAPTGVPAPVPAPAASAQAAAQAARQASATKTIFGMPAPSVDLMSAARAAAEAAASKPAPAQAQAAAAPAPAPAPAPAAAAAPPPAAAPAAAPPAMAAAAPQANKNVAKTMVGVPLAQAQQEMAQMAPARVVATSPRTTEPAGAVAEAESRRDDRKTGARKTAVPQPELAPPAAAMAASAPAASSAGEITRSTQAGYDSSPGRAAEPVRRAEAIRRAPTPTGEKTEPTRLAPRAPRQTSLLMYVGVGFTFGLALLAIYQLVGRLAH